MIEFSVLLIRPKKLECAFYIKLFKHGKLGRDSFDRNMRDQTRSQYSLHVFIMTGMEGDDFYTLGSRFITMAIL